MSVADTRRFLACVLIWGTTWLAITFQLGSVAPEASVAWRFGLAALIMPLDTLAYSFLGAAVFSLFLAVNHRRDRYVAV